MNRLLPLLISLSLTACFNAVGEAQCLRDLDCDAGTCVNNQCVSGAGGGASSGGGTATGGGTGMGGGAGGGISNGGGTGGAGGGIMSGGGVGGGTGGAGGGTMSGGGAGGGGGGIMVDGGPCNCRDALGRCQDGMSPIACGSGGNSCQACGFGEQCVNGACTMGACGPQSCAGCCTNNFCVVRNQQSRFACGAMGQACAQCPQGQTCTNGSCSTPVCNVMTCPTGCCANGMCETGQSRFACGLAGQQCMRCGMGMTCNSGICLPGGIDGGMPPTPDAGTQVPAGSACAGPQDCQPPFNATCIQENFGGQPTGYTGGYCTRNCGAGNPCTGGAVCITESFFGASQSTCRAPCMQPGTQSTCRTGYVCQSSSLSSVPGFCRARCDNMGALSACPTGQMCNTSTGACQ